MIFKGSLKHRSVASSKNVGVVADNVIGFEFTIPFAVHT